jgi:hypothetical protein
MKRYGIFLTVESELNASRHRKKRCTHKLLSFPQALELLSIFPVQM